MSIQLYKRQIASGLFKTRLTEPYPLHWHDFHELEIVISGRARHAINGYETELSRGSAYLLTPMDVHRLFEVRDITLITAKLSEREVSQSAAEILRDASSAMTASLAEAETAQIERGFAQIETRAQDEYARVFSGAFSEIMLAAFASAASLVTPDRRVTRMRCVLKYIRDNCAGSVTLADAARMANLSPGRFSTAFSGAVGVSFSEYLLRCRLSAAQKLLASDEISMAEVALRAGFGSRSQFFRSFQARYGMTPGQYKSDNT